MKIEVKVPAIGESIAEVTLGSWVKKDGDHVEEDEILCEVESEKATVEVTAEQAGVLHVKANEGDTLPIGAVIAEIDTAGRKQPASKPESETKVSADKQPERTAAPVKRTAEDEARITPLAANILQEAGIRADGLKGSGTGGRITKADALDLVKQATVSAESADQKPAEAASLPSAPSPAPSGRSVKRVRMTTLRKTISERMLAAKHGTAMLTTMNEIDLTRIKEIRGQYKDAFKEKYNVSLGFMSFFTKACCEALTEFPDVNAMIDGDEIVYHDFCDISIAVSTPKGLVVPVIRDAERMTLAQIEQQIGRIADKARENKLTIGEMTGGTFSITNGGVFGSLLSTPIINAPQSAILGMHTIQDRPVVRNGEIVIRPMMYVSLSYDHRIIDGKESVSFLVRVKELLEDPVRLLIGV